MAEVLCDLLKNGGGIEGTKRYSISESFTKSAAVTWGSTGSYVKRKGDVVACQFYFSGAVTSSAGGYVNIGTFVPALRPTTNVCAATTINVVSSGQVQGPASVLIAPDGTAYVFVGKPSTAIGNSTYPWCGTGGLRFEYTII